MSVLTGLVPGRIVYAETPDRNGRNPKRRPGVLLINPQGLGPDDTVYIVAVSSTFSDPLRDEEVPLPHSKDRGRRPMTRFAEPCVADCGWVIPVRLGNLESGDLGGLVPPRDLLEIVNRVRKRFPEVLP